MVAVIFDSIELEEMPNGLFISNVGRKDVVLISSERDALAVIESLTRMLEVIRGTTD